MITCPIHPREETSLASSTGTPALTSVVSMVRAQLPSTTVLEDELDVALSPGFCPGCDVDGNVALAFDSVFHVKHMPVNSDKAAVGQCSQPLYVSAEFRTVHVPAVVPLSGMVVKDGAGVPGVRLITPSSLVLSDYAKPRTFWPGTEAIFVGASMPVAVTVAACIRPVRLTSRACW